MARVRKEYYFVPCGDDGRFDAWDVDHLIERSKDFAVTQVLVDSIRELDTQHWFSADGSPFTVRVLARHVQLVNEVDPSYPIILGAEGQVMDGMHRVVRALVEGRATIAAVQFDEQPRADFKNVHPNDLTY
jgi:hypothetical protein